MQDSAAHLLGFRLWAAILLPAGLVLAGLGPALAALAIEPTAEWQRLALALAGRAAQLVLALGYAAGIVLLWHRPSGPRRLSGLAAAGRMALTNYLAQSLLFMVLLYGFGAGLLLYAGPTVSLVLAVAFYAVQIACSRWWLARYRFGPAEWLWRSWTYGARQPMRRLDGRPARG